MMVAGGISAVAARIASIEERFGSPRPSFAPALAAATSAQPSPAAATMALAGAVTTADSGPPAGDWAQGLPEHGRRWAPAIERAAKEADIDPRLLASLVWAESGFRADARSHAGAIGLAQLMPGTAAGLGVDPHDPQQNLDGGARYLAAQLRRFGRADHALAAYNAGPGRVLQAGGIPKIAETQAYVPRVLGYYAQLGGGS